jgi:hypothetical protein
MEKIRRLFHALALLISNFNKELNEKRDIVELVSIN